MVEKFIGRFVFEGRGRNLVDKEHNSGYTISPEVDWNFGLEEEGSSYIEKMLVLPVHHIILLR